jgi:LCP family protein required for cell wall assembly
MKRNQSIPSPDPLFKHPKVHRAWRTPLRVTGILLLALGLTTGSAYGAYRVMTRGILVVPIEVQPTVTVMAGSLDDVPLPDEITPDPLPTDPPGGPLPTPIDGITAAWDLKRLRAHYTVPIEYRAQKDPLVENILILGSDRKRSDTLGNTDGILVVSIDKRHGLLKMTSVLRDIRLGIPGRTLENKINAAYALGGPGLVINMLNDYLDLDIQRYVLVDIPSSSRFIDLCGGVRLQIDASERDAIGLAKTGLIRLDGRQTLAYAGLREFDSDTARTGRQREVVAALLDSFRAASATKQLKLVQSALSLLETNFNQDEILSRLALTLPSISGTADFVVPQAGEFVHVDGGLAGDWLTVDWEKSAKSLAEFLSA